LQCLPKPALPSCKEPSSLSQTPESVIFLTNSARFYTV
jgi:hypothetical protein